MLSCEFCKISNNTFFTEHIWATASSFTKEIVDQDYFCFYLKSVLLIFKEHRPKRLWKRLWVQQPLGTVDQFLNMPRKGAIALHETLLLVKHQPIFKQQILLILHSDFYLNLCCLTFLIYRNGSETVAQ